MLSEEKFDQIQKASFDEKSAFDSNNNDNKVIYQNIRRKGIKR